MKKAERDPHKKETLSLKGFSQLTNRLRKIGGKKEYLFDQTSYVGFLQLLNLLHHMSCPSLAKPHFRVRWNPLVRTHPKGSVDHGKFL
ncbi:hypothetical protein VNO77_08255 [Canavalia gladiata]|uniref:Uncharacterized protein n=1 Tax=Canavalia gladiata TaxID=3824 RepID=A0AAN9QWZ7_CANGL